MFSRYIIGRSLSSFDFQIGVISNDLFAGISRSSSELVKAIAKDRRVIALDEDAKLLVHPGPIGRGQIYLTLRYFHG